MKKIILVLTTVLFITSCAEKKSDANTHITGNIEGLTNGMIYLKKMNDSVVVAIDSVKLDGSSDFKFDFDIKSPEMMYLVINRGVTNSLDNSLPIFVEPGTITVNSDLKYFYSNAKITGSKNHELFDQFQKVNSKFNNELLEISKERYDAVRFKRLNDVDSITNKLNNKLTRKYLYAINFAISNKGHEVAPFIAVTELTNANIKYLDTINTSMTPKVAKSKYGKLLTSYLEELKKENQN